MEIDKKNYADYIKEITPVHNLWASMGKAFITGCVVYSHQPLFRLDY